MSPADPSREPIPLAAEPEARTHKSDRANQPDRPARHHKDKHCSGLPIFLHSSWRASHTWFWLKFREHSSTVCFYEPFHEILATVTRSEALSVGPSSWNSRHPSAEPYRLEFAPLIRKSGGVRLFVPEISYRWYVPDGGLCGSLRPQEVRYLGLLLRHAARLRQIPVFGFARSLGRLPALKKEFVGIHIFHYRNLWKQWISWLAYRENNQFYFFEKLLAIMNMSTEPYFLTIVDRYITPYFDCKRDVSTEGSSSDDLSQWTLKLLETMSQEHLFTVYMSFHLYVYMIAYMAADHVIDITRLARNMEYRQKISAELGFDTGLTIRFEDAVENDQYRTFDPTLINWQEIQENLKEAISRLSSFFDKEDLSRCGSQLVDDTVTEIERNGRYLEIAPNGITRLTNE
jgi:hypothetical protein